MTPLRLCLLLLLLGAPRVGAASVTLRLPASADAWLSDGAAWERDGGAGGSPVFKLKSVQEVAVIRFALDPVAGRRILSARLHLTPRPSEQAPREIRVSTVTAPWVEGRATRPYSGHDGATWVHADAGRRRPWAGPFSAVSDVIMGAGYSLVHRAEPRRRGDELVMDLPLDLIQALVGRRSDGLAVMESGSPRDRNHYFHSVQAWDHEPWLEVEVGDSLGSPPPARPVARVSAHPPPPTPPTGACG